MSEKEREKFKRDKTLKKARKMLKKIDDPYEARKIVQIIIASFDLSTDFLK